MSGQRGKGDALPMSASVAMPWKYYAEQWSCEKSPLSRDAGRTLKLRTEREELGGTCGFAVSTNMPVVLQDACDENIIRSGPAAAPCSKTSGRWILAATILASSMAFIDSTVVNVALPALQTNLNATATDVQWVVESYALFLSALLLVGGSLGDHYGRRRIFLLGVAIFAVASGACGLVGNIHQLIVARAFQGL